MKKMAICLFLASMFGSAQAATLNVGSPSAINFDGYNGQPETVTGPESSGLWGYLYTNSRGYFSATYLGNESGYFNMFVDGATQVLDETDSLGATITAYVSPGDLNPLKFWFQDSMGAIFNNGDAQGPVLGFAIMPGQTNAYGTFQYLLGFNDSSRSDADYDDFVVGVNFKPVPLPAALPLMASALGMLGIGAGLRRRRSEASAA